MDKIIRVRISEKEKKIIDQFINKKSSKTMMNSFKKVFVSTSLH